MKVHKLEPVIIEKIKSSNTINSITQCITELVLNSLDAKSTAIAIRVNFVTFRIQVVDNGHGISKDNLSLIGQRYMTNKCNSLVELETLLPFYGYRGEALASIINISKIVEITSKYESSLETRSISFKRTIRKDIISVKDRPSKGTTVTIEDFLYNLPLRKKRVIPELELVYVKRNIECLTIMYPNVSFSLRNDITGDVIMNSRKSNDVISSFRTLYPKISDEYSVIKVSKNNISVKGLIFKEMSENNYMQYIFVNKRPVRCSKIQSFIANILQKNKKHAKQIFCINTQFADQENKYLIYILNIKCPCFFVDILLSPTKTVVEFQNWDIILSCIQKLILSFLGISEKVTNDSYKTNYKQLKNTDGMSQINGMFKSYGFKRKSKSKDENSTPKKIKRLNSQNTEKSSFRELLDLTTQNHTYFTFSGRKCSNGIATMKNQSQKHSQKSNSKHIVDSSNSIKPLSYKNIESVVVTDINKTENELDIQENTNIEIYDLLPVKHVSRKNVQPLPITIFNKKDNTFKKPISYNTDVSHFNDRLMVEKIKEKHNITSNIPISTDLILEKLSCDKTFLSKFTNDENKGKNLIMDMFLKSTQVYNSEDESDRRSESTIVEIESNYIVENNVTTNINGRNKTMSVSINIKKKVKERRKVNKKHITTKSVQTSLEKKMFAKCVQTSFYQQRSKGNNNCDNFSNDTKLAENCTIILPTHKTPYVKYMYQNPINSPEMEQNKQTIGERSICKCNCHKNTSKIFNFDTLKTHQIVRNVYNNSEHVLDVSSLSINKRQINEKQADMNKCVNTSPYFLNRHYNLPKSALSTINNIYKERPILHNSNIGNITFFNMSTISPTYKFFNPYFQSTQVKHLYDQIFYNGITLEKNKKYKKVRNKSTTYSDPVKSDMNVRPNVNLKNDFETNNMNFSSFAEMKDQHVVSTNSSLLKANVDCNVNNYKPQPHSSHNLRERNNSCSLTNIRSQYNPLEKKDNFNFLKNDNKTHLKKEFFKTSYDQNHPQKVAANLNAYQINDAVSDFGELTKLFITLSNRQKEEILKNELHAEKEICNKMYLDWDSQMALSEEKKQYGKCGAEEFRQEWIKKWNDFGNSFYINRKTVPVYIPKKDRLRRTTSKLRKRTGGETPKESFTTFSTPKQVSNDFKLCKRFDFMPKGLSPVLNEIEEIDKSLSQNKKDKLQSYIVDCYQNELLMIKWQNYIKSNDPKSFFEEMYREKLNLLETKSVPTAFNTKKYFSELSNPISFDKSLFNNITVIGQADKKFIAVIEQKKHLLILFDQHAVDERIRLEGLLKGYTSTKIQDNFMVFLRPENIYLLQKHENYLNSLGLYVQFHKNGIKVIEVPLCLYNKYKNDGSSGTLNAVIQLLVEEITELVKDTGCVVFKTLPKIIKNIINLEACRGAIKFGDKLTIKDCDKLLKNLSTCNLPFQCAHGRPSLVPLLTLNLKSQIGPKKINLQKLVNKNS